MAKNRGNLQPAHRGYRYQDIAAAYMLVRSLVEQYDYVTVDCKKVEDDRIDDLEISNNGIRVRRQFKSSDNADRALSKADFVSGDSTLRLDRLILTHVRDVKKKAAEYRLCVTWRYPNAEDAICELLEPVQAEPTFSGTSSQVYRLKGDHIWPEGLQPIWGFLHPYAEPGAEFCRKDLLEFCDKFLIEIDLPRASTSLTEPGPFENSLLHLLAEQIGIGSYPNHSRNPADVAALAVSLANLARTQAQTLTPKEVEHSLEIRTDFGRISQEFPLDREKFHDRPEWRGELRKNCLQGGFHILIAPPGAGKSWELTKLAEELTDLGATVARHYCYLEPGDEFTDKRVTTDVLFGNLLAELHDVASESIRKSGARLSASLSELERALTELSKSAVQNVILIVDGLDHISRIRSQSRTLSDTETDIIEQLSTLNIPDNTSVIIGTQPGSHLSPLKASWKSQLKEYQLPSWGSTDIVSLAKKLGIDQALSKHELLESGDIDTILSALANRSEGSPLYARYLISGLSAGLRSGQIVNPNEWISEAPAISGDIAVYYAHLYRNASAQAQVVADLLGILDFSISESDLREIVPPLASWIKSALEALSPILMSTVSQGGVRIFHESFRRFMMDELTRQGRNYHDVLEPVIIWLLNRGFYRDAKSYRFLLPALNRAGRTSEILSIVSSSFVVDSISHAHPYEAIQRNLSLAADVAGKLLDWPHLIRCAELRRTLYSCMDPGANEWNEFWGTYLELFGADALTERLLFDGRPTLSRENGLQVCSLIDDAGGAPPWQEYLTLKREEVDDSHGYPNDDELSEAQITSLAGLHGRLRVGSRFAILRRIYAYLAQSSEKNQTLYVRRLSSRLARMTTPHIVEKLSQHLEARLLRENVPVGKIVTALHLGVADEYLRLGLDSKAHEAAAKALLATNTLEIAIQCFGLGLPLAVAEPLAKDPSSIDIGVSASQYLQGDEGLRHWFAALRLLAPKPDAPAMYEKELARIVGAGWYRCWLRFVILIVESENASKHSQAYDVKRAFHELTLDVDPFAGKPRPCDLYSIRSLIFDSISLSLTLLRTEDEWRYALNALLCVCSETGSRIDREDGGPLPIGVLIELIMPYVTHQKAAPLVQALIVQLVEKGHRMGTYYSTHASYAMSLAKMHIAEGDLARAKDCWKQACTYLTGYGWRKDITIFDIIESVPPLSSASKEAALTALVDLQPLINAVLRHTDGRETKHAPNEWFRCLLEVSPVDAIEVLSRTIAEEMGIESWPTVRALHDVARQTDALADPLLVDAIWGTVLFESDHDDVSSQRAEERLSPILKLATKRHSTARHSLSRLSAQVDGDGSRHIEGAVARVQEASREIGTAMQAGQVGSGHPPRRRRSTERRRPVQFEWLFLPPFCQSPTTVELLAGIRKLNKTSGWESSDEVKSAVLTLSYAIGSLIDEGHEGDAKRVIYYFARSGADTYSSKLHPISSLGLGLDNAGYASMAAVAYSLAYTSTRGGGGWLSLGDSTHSNTLQRAILLDRETALATVAGDVAYRLRITEYGAGISRHLIQRISEWGDGDIALLAWKEAFAVISLRLPLSSDRGYFANFSTSKTSAFTIDEALVLLLLSRLSEPRLTRKIAALAGIVQSIQHRPDAVSSPLRQWLLLDSHNSSIILVFHALLCMQDKSIEIIRSLSDVLSDYAQCPLWGISQLARLLLENAELDVPTKSTQASAALDSADLSEGQRELLFGACDGESLELIGNYWPEHQSHIWNELQRLIEAPAHKESMIERYKLMVGRNKEAWPPVRILRWETELFLSAQHQVLTQLPEQLWQSGQWTTDIELYLLMATLPDSAVHLGLAASRIARPEYREPSSSGNSLQPAFILPAESGDYAGWIRLGLIESQFVNNPDRRFGRPVEHVQLFAGLVAVPFGEKAPADAFPFRDGNPDCWWELDNNKSKSARARIVGPVVRCTRVKDWLDNQLILIPPSTVDNQMHVQKPGFGDPLTWLDGSGNPVVVLRTWRVINQNQYDAESLLFEGCDLIARPDVIDMIEALSIAPLQELIVIQRESIDPL